MHYFKLVIGPGSFVLNPHELDDTFGFINGYNNLVPQNKIMQLGENI